MNYELKGLVHHDTKLSDIVIAEPTALTVLNRFGIYLGLGDLTVARACDKLGIDKDFLATDRKSTRLNSSHLRTSRMPSSA